MADNQRAKGLRNAAREVMSLLLDYIILLPRRKDNETRKEKLIKAAAALVEAVVKLERQTTKWIESQD